MEIADNQAFAKTSIFGRFHAQVCFISNEWPFLGAEIQNLFDKQQNTPTHSHERCWGLLLHAICYV
jgi:hypothetical protein